jgi:hypothetical protein
MFLADAGVTGHPLQFINTTTGSTITNLGATPQSLTLSGHRGGDVLLTGGAVKINGAAAVDVSSAQTLTNKTLTAAKVDDFYANNLGTIMLSLHDWNASANCYFRMENQFNGPPRLMAMGRPSSPADIPMMLLPKGDSDIIIGKSVPGKTANISAFNTGTGENATCALNLKGTEIQANGVPVVTTTAAQSLSNKTLADPTISGSLKFQNPTNAFLKSGTGANYAMFGQPNPAVANYVQFNNAPTNNAPTVWANGTDANIGLVFVPKGTGVVQVTVQQKPGQTVGIGDCPVGVKVPVPASATAPGSVGEWAADTDWHYICTATNVWKTVPLTAGFKDKFPVRMVPKPAITTSAGTIGDFSVDSNYMYICWGANAWGRIPLDTAW